MGRRRCCCLVGCELDTDDFDDRSDGPVPGDDPKWIDTGGNWEFGGGHLVSTDEGPVITRNRKHRKAKQPPAERTYNYVVYFEAVNLGHPSEESPDLIDEFGVIVNYTDTNNFDWVKFTLDESGLALWPSFMRRDGGSDEVLMDKESHPAGNSFGITHQGTFVGRICYADVEWSVTPSSKPPDTGSPVSFLWTLCGGGADTLPDSPHGFVGFLYGQFDFWAFWDHWEVDRECPYCSCFCRNPGDTDDYSCLPEELLATIVPQHSTGEYSAPNLDYKEIELKQVADIFTSPPNPLSPVKERWRAQAMIDQNYHYTADFWLTCSVLLSLKTSFGQLFWEEGSPDFQQVNWEETTCRPLKIVFKGLGGSYTQCELPGGGYGIHMDADYQSDCLEDIPVNRQYLENLRWDIVITEKE